MMHLVTLLAPAGVPGVPGISGVPGVTLTPGLPGLPGGSGVAGFSLGGSLASSVLGGLSTAVGAGAAWLLHRVADLVFPVGGLHLGAAWLALEERSMRVVALGCVLPLLFVATAGAVLHQDARRLVRVWCVGLPVGLIGGISGAVLVTYANRLVDELCRELGGRATGAGLDRIASVLELPGLPSVVRLILSGLVVLGAVLLWLELVLRTTAIYLALFFFPLGMATVIWPATAPIARRFVEVLAALVLSKFVVVATLTFGVAAIGATHASVNSVLVGTAVLLLGAFAPFALLRLIPLVEFGAIAHLEGLSHRPHRAALRAAGSAAGQAGRVASAAGGATAGLLAAGADAGGIPMRAADWSLDGGWIGEDAGRGGGGGGAGEAGGGGAGPGAAGGEGRSGPPTGPPPPASPGIGLDVAATGPVGSPRGAGGVGTRPVPAGAASAGAVSAGAVSAGAVSEPGAAGQGAIPPPASPGIAIAPAEGTGGPTYPSEGTGSPGATPGGPGRWWVLDEPGAPRDGAP